MGDPRIALAFNKLFLRAEQFAAQQASHFSKLASGDVGSIDAVLKLADNPSYDHGGNPANGTKRKKRKIDPDAPKKPKSGYQLFMSEKTPSFREQHPEMKMKDFMPIIANDWKALNEKEKKNYQKKASEEKSLYEEKLATYKAGGGNGTEAAASGGKDEATAAEGDVAAEHLDGEGEEEEEGEHHYHKSHKKKKKKHKKERSKE